MTIKVLTSVNKPCMQRAPVSTVGNRSRNSAEANMSKSAVPKTTTALMPASIGLLTKDPVHADWDAVICNSDHLYSLNGLADCLTDAGHMPQLPGGASNAAKSPTWAATAQSSKQPAHGPTVRFATTSETPAGYTQRSAP